MKNSKLVKIFLVGLVSAVLMLATTQTFAADDSNFIELDINSAVTSTNTATNTALNTTSNVTNPINATTSTNTTNTSSYNNTSLPKTGIEDSGVMLFVIAGLAVSAIYAFKKVRDYNNI